MRQAPPLTVWAAGAALAAGVIVLAFLRHNAMAAAPQPQQLMAAFASKILAAPRQPGELRVLGLGTSLLWAATPPGQIDPPHQPAWLNWVRLIKGGPGLGALAQALAQVERAPPDVVVVEKTLLFEEEGSGIDELVKIDIKHALKTALLVVANGALPAMLLQSKAKLPLAEQSMAFQCTPGFAGLSPQQRIGYATYLRRAYAQPTPDPVLTAALLRLARRGVRVVILDVPRSAELERPSAADKARWYARLRQALPPGPILRYQAAPSYQDTRLYCDGAHLNGAGSRRFGPWWLAQLVALREGAP